MLFWQNFDKILTKVLCWKLIRYFDKFWCSQRWKASLRWHFCFSFYSWQVDNWLKQHEWILPGLSTKIYRHPRYYQWDVAIYNKSIQNVLKTRTFFNGQSYITFISAFRSYWNYLENMMMWLPSMMTSWNGNFFPRYWSFVRGIHRSPVNSQHKCQWRGALVFSLICPWLNSRVNSREVGDLRRHRADYDVTVMSP